MSTTKNDGGPQMTPPTLKQILEKATPGPWFCRDRGDESFLATNFKYDIESQAFRVARAEGMGTMPEANAQLIARCSPSTMLAVVEALENAISIRRADAKQFREQSDGRMAMASDAAAERWEIALNLLNGKAP